MKSLRATVRRNRRWILITAVAVAIAAGILPFASRSSRTNRVIAAARAQGASVSAEFTGPDWLGDALDHVPWVKSLLETRITWVRYSKPEERKFKPIDLRYLANAPEIQNLDLIDAFDVTDADLEIVGQLECLTLLFVCSSKVTNEGLAHLSSLHQMEALWIIESEIDDEGLRCLSDMRKLRSLWIRGLPGFSGEGLKYLPRECRLEDLNVAGTSLNHGLELIELGSLNHFRARVTPLTDAGLAPLKEARALQFLGLSNTQVTDESLRHLDQLQQLTAVSLEGTPVTKAGAERLAAQLPNVSVAHGPSHKDWEWTDGAAVQRK